MSDEASLDVGIKCKSFVALSITTRMLLLFRTVLGKPSIQGRTSPLRCYQCGSRDHLQRECPNFRGSGHSNSPRGRNSSRNYNRTRSSSHGSIHILNTRGRSDSSVSSRTSSTDSRTSIKSGVLALTPLFTFSGKLWKKDVHVILDSGATENFVNAKITRECEAKQYSLENPINVWFVLL